MGFIIIVFGLFNVIFPRAAWFIEKGWKFNDAEPSEEYLTFIRILGVIICIIGIFKI